MGKTTGISWTHHTHNLWWGCEKVSSACDHCYAERDSKRYGHDVWGHASPRRFFTQKHYDEPLRWNAQAEALGERRRVFCGSMMDICEVHIDQATNAFMNSYRRDLFYRIMPKTPWLDWLLLTKRPANYTAILPPSWVKSGCPSNIWLGTTAENQFWLDNRAPWLLRVDAFVHFISYEPALGPLDLLPWMDHECGDPPHGRCPNQINWLIVGGESGGGWREAEVEWFRAALRQCRLAHVPFWFKQHSAFNPKLLGDKLDGVQYHELPRVA